MTKELKGKPITANQNLGLSTNEILQEIGESLNKEKKRRAKVKNKNSEAVLELDEQSLIKSGTPDFSSPMSEDLATLKSLIQNVVRHEIIKIQKV
jgi:hypothetical protein